MVECEVVARRWGHSLGVTLPRDIVDKERIKENQKIKIIVLNEDRTAQSLFGMMKFKRSAQQMKDEFRKELYND